jgi:Bacterial PH domain
LFTLTFIPLLILVVILAVAYALAPQKTSVVGNVLTVKTNFSSLTYDLNQMLGARPVPHDATRTRNAIKLFGLGWPMKPHGYFRNRELGTFLAFVTNRDKMVLVTLPNKKLLVSPENSEVLLRRVGTQ